MIRKYHGKAPIVHPTAFVSEAAYIVGEVEIGENSGIWPGTVIRGDSGDIIIGKNTNIQDNCVVHTDHHANIGNNVTMGHAAISHAALIESFCLIGNNATLNEGVEVGEFSLIAANSVVLEGIKIPPKSLVVGVPAKIISSVKQRHIDLIKSTAEIYIKKAQSFREEGL